MEQQESVNYNCQPDTDTPGDNTRIDADTTTLSGESDDNKHLKKLHNTDPEQSRVAVSKYCSFIKIPQMLEGHKNGLKYDIVQ